MSTACGRVPSRSSAAVSVAVAGASRPFVRGQDGLATAGRMPALLVRREREKWGTRSLPIPRGLALVQALDVGVGVDASGVGFVDLPERGGVAEGDSVSALAQRLHGGHSGNAGIEDARGQGPGGLRRGDFDLAGIFGDILADICGRRRFDLRLAPEDSGEIGLSLATATEGDGGCGVDSVTGVLTLASGAESDRVGVAMGWRNSGESVVIRYCGPEGKVRVLSGTDSSQ